MKLGLGAALDAIMQRIFVLKVVVYDGQMVPDRAVAAETALDPHYAASDPCLFHVISHDKIDIHGAPAFVIEPVLGGIIMMPF